MSDTAFGPEWLTADETAFVSAHPEVASFLSKAEPRMFSAIVMAARESFEQGKAEAEAEGKAPASLTSEELRSLAKAGDCRAVAILEVREGGIPAPAAPSGSSAVAAEVVRLGAQMGVTAADVIRYGGAPDVPGESDPENELARMAAKAGVSMESVKKFGREPGEEHA